jgi:glycosyltransferase involved in cell wall biosynthesis
MASTPPRVAYFPDSLHEINGVAHTSRQFEAFARRRNLPFLCIRAGDRAQPFIKQGEVETLELRRGMFSFALDKDLRYDLAFARHLPLMTKTLRAFRPDVIHITGPSEMGMLGALLAHHLEVPLVASWHTNVHEYLARRCIWFLRMLPPESGDRLGQQIEDLTLATAARFYMLARILFAPNQQLCDLLQAATHRRCFLMPRGVDTNLFAPHFRTRKKEDDEFVLGFVGRLSIEKNVALLATLREELLHRGITRFRFLIVGQGAEEPWLRLNLPNAEFTGVLRGADLARAYANMDLFVFPSHTDTFGNVVLEALASGVPAIVTPDGGPAYIVQASEAGFIATDDEFADAVSEIMLSPTLHTQMRQNACTYASKASWDSVFDGVYSAYDFALKKNYSV